MGTEEEFSSFLLHIPSDNAGRSVIQGALSSSLSPEHGKNSSPNPSKQNPGVAAVVSSMLVVGMLRVVSVAENFISKYVVQQLKQSFWHVCAKLKKWGSSGT